MNRAHGPTKQNTRNFYMFSIFPVHAKKMPEMAPNGARSFFPTNPDLANILGRTDLDFENFLYSFGCQISGNMDAQLSGKQKTRCQETLCHLSQGTGLYLASWSCLCSAVLGHPPPPCPSTALHRHDQLAKYHPVPWLR